MTHGRFRLRKTVLVSAVVLTGCLTIGPSTVEVVFNNFTKQLVKGVPATDMKIYSISMSQSKAIGNIYTDRLMVRNYVEAGSIAGFSAMLNELNDQDLKNHFAVYVMPLWERLPLSAAIAKYELELDRVKRELSRETNNLKEIESVLMSFKSMFKDVDRKHEQLISEQSQVARSKDNLNRKVIKQFRVAGYDIAGSTTTLNSAVTDVLGEYRFSPSRKGSCYRYKDKYEYTLAYGGFCYMVNYPYEHLDNPVLKDVYLDAFKVYISFDYRLLVQSTPAKGTIQFDLSVVEKERWKVLREAEKKYGAYKDIENAISKQQAVISRVNYALEDLINSRNSIIIDHMGDGFDDFRDAMLSQVDLSQPNSILYQKTIAVMNTIAAQHLNKNYEVPFSNEALMFVLQVDALDRKKFPVFSRAHIVELSEIKDLDKFPLSVSQKTIEYTHEEGAIATLVDVIGMGLSRWQAFSTASVSSE